jgi:hypothetical protein
MDPVSRYPSFVPVYFLHSQLRQDPIEHPLELDPSAMLIRGDKA